jgi:Tfp pilus assembly protein PilV
MFIKKLLKNSKGDTIVEVLLSIATLSLVLTVSYALTNRNSQYIQQSQERSEAQNISEQQLELLRDYLEPATDWNASHFICFDNANPPQPTANNNQCFKGIQDVPGVGRYHTVISYDDATHTYTVETTWSSLTGATQQNLDLSYKLPVSALTPIGLAPACRNHFDDDGDGLKDAADPGCHPSDYNASNPASYSPNYTTEVQPVTLTVQKSPSAGGTVTGSGINCGATCVRANIAYGTAVSLSASAAANYTFTGWTPNSCNSFVITSNTTCRAHFAHSPSPPRQPLYRCYSIYTGSDIRFVTDHHFGVPGAGTCYPSIHNDAWWINYEGIAGYVPTDNTYPTSYVYGGWNSDRCGGWINPSPWWDHFYTASYQEYVNAHYAGWCSESGYEGWSVLNDGSAPGSVPMYRWWNGAIGDHFYTTSWQEGINSGYTYEGIFGWVYANP